jgi:hypothetical protein
MAGMAGTVAGNTPPRIETTPAATNPRSAGTITAASIAAVHSRKERAMLDTRTVTWALGTFTAVSFLLCVLYGLVTPESLHMHQFLEIVLPAFRWLTVGSFFLGLVESFLWGVYAGLVFTPIYNGFHRRRVGRQ